ncbi:prepilin-type N-terminal cleavage/methylation domain-containing protein [Gammaproteobacteria bacterium]|jgi:prepilin-type N-terminal cleavage/methylation domain-containing protein|nr:prepilin-type N-terminal cleavage/methylation domain-containing protein [Gammaproteobacteria bacterium]
MKKRTQSGFTLYELLITVVIVGVVLSFGLPNLREFTQNSRMTGAANDLHAAFQVARSEAARAKTNITICASANSLAADASCGGTWDQGFIVFVDENADLARAGDTESVLRAHSEVAEGVTLVFANDARYFMYASTGLGRIVPGNPAVSQVVMCDERGNVTAAGGNSAARLFVATPLGRATILRDKDLIDAALANIGGTCP